MKKFVITLILSTVTLMTLSSCTNTQAVPDTDSENTLIEQSSSVSESTSTTESTPEDKLIKCFIKSDFTGDLSKSIVFTEPDADEEYINEIVFYPSEEIYDLELCAISFPYTEETPFAIDKIHKTFNKISPDSPLIYRMTFPGDAPNTGFRFRDKNGTEYIYAIYQSGYDNSIIIELLETK